MKSKTPAQTKRWRIVFMLVLGLLPFSNAARAQAVATFDDAYDRISPDTNVVIEPYYDILGYVAPIRDFTGLIVDRDRLPFAPPVPELRRNIELPMMIPGDRRGIVFRTLRDEPPGTILQIPPREQTRVELERRYRERLESEIQSELIYSLVAPLRTGTE